MQADLDSVLVSRERIAERIGEMARRIIADLTEELSREGDAAAEHKVVFVPVMTGGLFFAADLIRELPMKFRLELIAVSSYPGTSTVSKGARIDSELPDGLEGCHVVVLDDVLDSGRTMALVRERILARGAASVRVAVMLDKKARRAVDIAADYVGFEIPDAFVVGYGLDFDGYYRNLPYVATLKAEAIEAARAAAARSAAGGAG